MDEQTADDCDMTPDDVVALRALCEQATQIVNDAVRSGECRWCDAETCRGAPHKTGCFVEPLGSATEKAWVALPVLLEENEWLKATVASDTDTIAGATEQIATLAETVAQLKAELGEALQRELKEVGSGLWRLPDEVAALQARLAALTGGGT